MNLEKENFLKPHMSLGLIMVAREPLMMINSLIVPQYN